MPLFYLREGTGNISDSFLSVGRAKSRHPQEMNGAKLQCSHDNYYKISISNVWGQVFGLVIETPLIGSARVLALAPCPILISCKCLPWEVAEDGSRSWVPDTLLGPLD